MMLLALVSRLWWLCYIESAVYTLLITLHLTELRFIFTFVIDLHG